MAVHRAVDASYFGTLSMPASTCICILTMCMQQAMEVIGFQPDEISGMLEFLASILNLGNVQFVGSSLPDGTDMCCIEDKMRTFVLVLMI